MHDLFSIPDFDPAPRKAPDAVSPAGASSPGITGAVASPVRRPDDQRRNADAGYYNTTRLSGRELAAARKDAMTQQDRIRKLFESMPDGWLATPSKVHQLVGGGAPITSIRRAMTNLTDDSILTRTDVQRPGPYGKPEFAWRKAITEQRRAA